ncbi:MULTISPECIES: type II CAAX endopeptidase family protein [Actinoplanes]|uniref:CPBP family intramembrane glutamic endopeptidase n=1 Tax=Actinoplanes TaxID=1865 RepID=UPI0005F2BE62|nr:MULTISPECIES: type II CAAX endopeptidase family protein [Actinoplanes]GLY05073.1 CAAX amino protease [Actinoplanes sp. NBRC 101535]
MTTLLATPPQAVAPAPVPYHLLARTGSPGRWRPIAGTFVILFGLPLMLAGGMGAADAIVTLAGGRAEEVLGGAAGELPRTLLTLGALIPMTLLAAWWVQRRRPGTVSSVAGRLRWRWMTTCALVAVPMMALNLGFVALLPGAGLESGPADGSRMLVGAVVVMLLVPLQAAGEEYFFRGWLLQAFGSWMRTPWPGVVVSSVLFGLAHGLGSGWGLAAMVLCGLVLSVLTIRTGGLEAAIGLHVINNVAVFGLLIVTGAVDAADRPVAATEAIADMVMMALYGLAVLWLARRRQLT